MLTWWNNHKFLPCTIYMVLFLNVIIDPILFPPYLAVALACRLVTTRIEPTVLWTVTRTADRRTPPGGRAGVVYAVLAVLTRVTMGTFTHIAVRGRHCWLTVGTIFARVPFAADAFALWPDITCARHGKKSKLESCQDFLVTYYYIMTSGDNTINVI